MVNLDERCGRRASARRRRLLPVLWLKPKRYPLNRPRNPSLFRYKALVSGQCHVCDAWFVDKWADARYCSTQCRDEEWDRREHAGRVSGYVRRTVYERDGWVCQLCFEPVIPTLHWLHPRAATIDHIICRSWVTVVDNRPSNLRLAHRLCNTLRSDAA